MCLFSTVLLQSGCLHPLLENVCSFWTLNPRVHTPCSLVLKWKARALLLVRKGCEQGTLPALGEYVPRCVFAMKFPFTRVPRFPSLLTGPSFHIRSKPPTRFSFPVSLQHRIHELKYLSNDYLSVHGNKLPVRDRAEQLKAVDIFLLLISEVSTVVKSIMKWCKTSFLEQIAPEVIGVGGTMQKKLKEFLCKSQL